MMANTLISNRLPGLQHPLDPLEGLIVLQQLQERLLFEAEQVLLAHPLGESEVAARQNFRGVAGYYAVVLAGVAAPLQGPDAHDERGSGRGAGGVDVAVALGRGVAVCEVEGLALGSGDEVVGVHHYPVVLVQEAEPAGLDGARGDLRHGYGLEGYVQEGECRGVGGRAHRSGDEAADHLLGAAAGRYQADAGLDEAHVGLAGGDYAAGAEGEIDPPAAPRPARQPHYPRATL